MCRNVILSVAVVVGLFAFLSGSQARASSSAYPYYVTANGLSSPIMADSYADAVSTANYLKWLGFSNIQIHANQARQVWYRVYLYEWDRGYRQWRSVGTFENPSQDFVVRYAQSFVAVDPRYRAWTGPVAFYR
jgi:hypothetical protein